VIVARSKPRCCCGFPSPVGAAAVVDVVIVSEEEEAVVDVAECCGGGRNDGALPRVPSFATFLSSPASFIKPPLVAALPASPTPDDDDGDDFFLDMNLFHMIWARGEDTGEGGFACYLLAFGLTIVTPTISGDSSTVSYA